MRNNFIVPIVDTDSITICKPDFSEFSKEEINSLTDDLNSKFDEMINWEFEFYNPKIICFKAKNYVLFDGKNIKIKGSALKMSTKERALKEFADRIMNYLIYTDEVNNEDITVIYNEYVKEISSIKDISRWATRKTISSRTLESARKNETRIKDAIQGTEIVEGDRCYVYYKDKDTLELAERFDGNYDKDRLYGKLSDTAWVFETILDCESLFKNYKLKKNKKDLEILINEDVLYELNEQALSNYG